MRIANAVFLYVYVLPTQMDTFKMFRFQSVSVCVCVFGRCWRNSVGAYYSATICTR